MGCHFSFIFSLRSIPFCRSCGRSRGFPSSLERPQPAPGSCRIWTRNINRVPLPNPKGAREFLGRWKLLGRKTKVPAPQARLVYLKWLGGVPLYLLNQQFEAIRGKLTNIFRTERGLQKNLLIPGYAGCIPDSQIQTCIENFLLKCIRIITTLKWECSTMIYWKLGDIHYYTLLFVRV